MLQGQRKDVWRESERKERTYESKKGGLQKWLDKAPTFRDVSIVILRFPCILEQMSV